MTVPTRYGLDRGWPVVSGSASAAPAVPGGGVPVGFELVTFKGVVVTSGGSPVYARIV